MILLCLVNRILVVSSQSKILRYKHVRVSGGEFFRVWKLAREICVCVCKCLVMHVNQDRSGRSFGPGLFATVTESVRDEHLQMVL